MQSNIAKFAGGLCLLGVLGTARAQSTWNYFLSDAGGGNSLLTWSVTGELASAPGANWISMAPLMAVPISAPGIFADSFIADGTPQPLPTPDGSYFYDTLGGLQGAIAAYYTYSTGGSDADGFGLMVPTFFTHGTERLIYYPGTQSALIPVPFADFNPGTYESQMLQFLPALTVDLTVGPVPEPSTLTLFAVGGLSALLLRRRTCAATRTGDCADADSAVSRAFRPHQRSRIQIHAAWPLS